MRSNKARIRLENLESRALLTTTVGFDDGTTQVVNDQVGTVDVHVMSVGNSPTNDSQPVTVTITTGGGTAVPGVDYTPVQQTITLTPMTLGSPGFTNHTQMTIPILPGPASLGTRVLQVSVSPSPGAPQGQSEDIVITHGADTTPPYIVQSQALTQGGKVVAFALQFSKPMAVGPVTDLANYIAVAPKSASQIGGAIMSGGTGMTYTKNIPLKSATYDAATNTVFLVPVNPVKPNTNARIARIGFQVGSPPSASFSSLADTSGNPIAGADLGSFTQFPQTIKASPSVLTYLFGTPTPATPKGHAKHIHKVK